MIYSQHIAGHPQMEHLKHAVGTHPETDNGNNPTSVTRILSGLPEGKFQVSIYELDGPFYERN